MTDQAILVMGSPVRLFNHGMTRRDLACIDGVTRVVSKLIDIAPADNPAAANAPLRPDKVLK